MGYFCHQAIIVSSHDAQAIQAAHDMAVEIFTDKQVTPILPPAINSLFTFFVGPDGSKEGWHESLQGDAQRAEFVHWCKQNGNGYLMAGEVQYYDENDSYWVRSIKNGN